MKKTALALVAVACALAIASSAMGRASVTTLKGTVGPGFTISLKMGTKKVTSLKAGSYKFVIADKSGIHNFHVSGPGVNKDLTSVGFVGTKTVTLKLKKGKYTYFCVPHKSLMHGSFTVT
jgi:plastocyanin